MSNTLRLSAFVVGALALSALIMPSSASAFPAVAPASGIVAGAGAAVENVTYSYRRNYTNSFPYFLFYRSRPNYNYNYQYYRPKPNYYNNYNYNYNYQPRRYYLQYRYY